MRFRSLRKLLSGAALAALGACSCPDVENTVVIREPDQKTLDLLDRCRADASDCEELCRAAVDLYEGPGASAYVAAFDRCELVRAPTGEDAVHYKYAMACVGGRRPDGWSGRREARAGNVVGGWFAIQAELEAASVRAFVDLARELRAHGAPARLARAAERAAADEVIHAALCARLAARYGGAPRTPVLAPARVRSLGELAAENAVEGCVRETWGAALAAWQARASADPVVRAVMARVAVDETRHAALAHAIDRWARPRVDAAALDAARRGAVAELAAGLADVPAELVAAAGLPGADRARALFALVGDSVWA